MTQFNRNVWLRKGLRAKGLANPEYYGAKAGISIDNKQPLQDAIDDLYTNDGGGKVLLGPLVYRFNTSLTLRPGVSIVGSGPNTHLANGSTTLNGFEFATGTNYNEPTLVSDLNFGALVTSTGKLFNLSSITNQRWRFVRCAINAPSGYSGLNGPLLTMNGTSDALDIAFEDCYVGVQADGPAFDLNSPTCRTNFIRGTCVMPSTFNSHLIAYFKGGGLIDGLKFDVNGHGSGSGNCLFVSNTAEGEILLVNNVKAQKDAAGATTWFMAGNAGAYVQTSNIFTGANVGRYNFGGTLAYGSRLELNPQLNDLGSLTYNIRNWVASITIVQQTPGNPVFNLPTGLFPGQRMVITIINDTGTTIGGYSFGGVTGYAPTSIPNGTAVSFEVVYTAKTLTPAYTWMITGTPLGPFVPA